MFDILVGLAICLGVAFILRVLTVGEDETDYKDLRMIALWPFWAAVTVIMVFAAMMEDAGRNIARLINKCGGKL